MSLEQLQRESQTRNAMLTELEIKVLEAKADNDLLLSLILCTHPTLEKEELPDFNKKMFHIYMNESTIRGKK
ncbi:MAG: hypothetical protein U9O94_10795 [Nanoarchaeota archaeon]|nr:hypothetical protein [Nanoarchaeota archaeon]